jgi:hypothetical protein
MAGSQYPKEVLLKCKENMGNPKKRYCLWLCLGVHQPRLRMKKTKPINQQSPILATVFFS